MAENKDVTVEEKEQPSATETTISKDENTGDVTITEEETPTTEETTVEETPQPTEEETLDPNLFETETPATEETSGAPESYDLSSFGFNEQQMEALQPSLDKFKEAGMNQDQVELVFNEIVGEPTDYKAILTEQLSTEEKMNYKPIFEMLTNIEGMNPKEIEAVMKDVASFRFVNRLFNSLNGGGQRMRTPAGAAAASGLSSDELRNKFKEFSRQANVSKDKRGEFISSLIDGAQDKEWAQNYFKQYL